MGMFDEIRALNIAHDNFNDMHNGYTFQTKDLDCDMSRYCIFNGELYQELDNEGYQSKRHSKAVKFHFTGVINMYTYINKDRLELWVEYDLKFSDGNLVDVIAKDVEVTEDRRDFSSSRPNKPDNRVEVTINIRHCDTDKQNAFLQAFSDEKIEAIRQILDEPSATVFYPAKRDRNQLEVGSGFLASFPRILTVASVVKTLEEINAEAKDKRKITAPNGDVIIVLDEMDRI